MGTRNKVNLSARILLVLSLFALGTILLQHRILNRVGGDSLSSQGYGVNFNAFTEQNRNLHRGRNSAIGTTPVFHTCAIQNRTVRVPIAPQFIIAGAQKCGTTALYEFLNEHPELKGSAKDEVHFFDWHYPADDRRLEWLTEHNISTGISEQEYLCVLQEMYGKEFPFAYNESKIHFEKTPSYLFLTMVPKRIFLTCPSKPKIILILRNPVDRAFSHFRMGVRVHGRSFDQLIDEEIENMRLIGLSQAPLRKENYSAQDPGFQIPNFTQKESEDIHWRHYRRMFANNYLQRGMYITQIYHKSIDESEKGPVVIMGCVFMNEKGEGVVLWRTEILSCK